MAKKSKNSKPTEIDLDEVRAYLRSDKEGHQNSNLPQSVEILRDSDDSFHKQIILQTILEVDRGIEPAQTEAPPALEKKEPEKKPAWLSQIIKTLIYQPDKVRKEEMESLLRHVQKRVYRRFIQIQNMIIDRSKTSFDVHEITSKIITSMYAPDGFFNYFKATNPEPDRVKNEIVWKKFDHRLDEKINDMYEKYLDRVLKGILDSSAIEPDEDGEVDFGRVHWDGSMAKKDRSDELEE